MIGPSPLARAKELLESRLPQLVQSAASVVQRPSVTGHEDLVAPLFASLLQESGFEVDVWCPTARDVESVYPFCEQEIRLGERPNVVGVRRGRRGRPSVTVNGHMDVVPPGDIGKWTRDPFSGEIAGGRLHGRGSADMKAGLVACIYAVSALLEVAGDEIGDVIVQCVIAEETGGLGTVAAVERGYITEAALVPEPTEMALVPAQAGLLKWRIEVPGRSAHTAVPWFGESALDAWIAIYQDLQAFAAQRELRLHHPLFESLPAKVPFACGRVVAGDYPYSIPEVAIAEGRIGALPGESLSTLRQEFEEVVAEAVARSERTLISPPRVEWVAGEFPGWELEESERSLLNALAAAHASVTGREPRLEGVTYATDASFLRRVGVNPVVFGAGSIREAHRVDEWIATADLEDHARIVLEALALWFQEGDGGLP